MNTKIDRLLKNYSNARKSWECWCFMVNYKLEKPDFAVVAKVNENPLLFHLRYLALKDFYIEAYKVLKNSRNNADNIFLQLKELAEKDKSFSEKINAHYAELKEQEEIIFRICNLRDKFYAHLDKEYEDFIGGDSIPDIVACFNAIERAIITLTSQDVLQQYLDGIPSRDEHTL